MLSPSSSFLGIAFGSAAEGTAEDPPKEGKYILRGKERNWKIFEEVCFKKWKINPQKRFETKRNDKSSGRGDSGKKKVKWRFNSGSSAAGGEVYVHLNALAAAIFGNWKRGKRRGNCWVGTWKFKESLGIEKWLISEKKTSSGLACSARKPHSTPRSLSRKNPEPGPPWSWQKDEFEINSNKRKPFWKLFRNSTEDFAVGRGSPKAGAPLSVQHL